MRAQVPDRGLTWNTPDFKDPCPVPLELKIQYQREMKAADLRYQEEERLAKIAREEHRKKKKEERYAASQLKVEQRKQISALRKEERDQFLQKPIEGQVRLLALDETRMVKAFPIDPNAISSKVLEKLDNNSLDKLAERISKQWQKPWKKLAQRIDALRKEKRLKGE